MRRWGGGGGGGGGPPPPPPTAPEPCEPTKLRPFRRILDLVDFAPLRLRELVASEPTVLVARVSGPTEQVRVRRYGRGFGVEVELLEELKSESDRALGDTFRVWFPAGDPGPPRASLPVGARVLVVGEPERASDGGTAVVVGLQGLLLEDCGRMVPVVGMPRGVPDDARTLTAMTDLIGSWVRG